MGAAATGAISGEHSIGYEKRLFDQSRVHTLDIAMDDWDRATKTKGEHYEIYKAIASGNADLAAELTAQHITNAKIHMMEGLNHG